MKFEKVSAKKTWKSPVLEHLAHDDQRVREAVAGNTQFRDAAQRLSIKA